MKFRPILFSTLMVKAILEGRKTQTRRIVKLKHLDIAEVGAIHPDGSGKGWIAWQPGKGVTAEFTKEAYPGNNGFPCPYGQIGDVLWIRESWTWIEGFSGAGYYCFRADHDLTKFCPKWHPSIFMPKEACRIFLEIADIRVERLYDIGESDAVSEGIEKWPDGFDYKNYIEAGRYRHAKDSFFSLWEMINGKESLKANPWTWAITFKQIDKPEDFI